MNSSTNSKDYISLLPIEWKIVYLHEPMKSFYEVNTKDKILYVNNYDLEQASLNVIKQYLSLNN